MEMREWLSIIVLVAIVLILADGFRRKIRDRHALRVKLDKKLPGGDPDEEYGSELPNGGARTISRSGGQPRAEAHRDHRDEAEEDVPVLIDEADDYDDEEDAAPPSRYAAEASADEDEETWDEYYSDEDYAAAAEQAAGPADAPRPEAEAAADYEDQDDEAEDHYFHPDPSGRIEPTFGEDDPFSDEELEDDRDTAARQRGDDERLRAAREDARREAPAPEPGSEKSRREAPTPEPGPEAAPVSSRAEQRERPEPKPRRGGFWSRDKQTELPLSDADDDGAGADDVDYDDEDSEEAGVGEVIVINVMARRGEVFSGRAMLPVLMSQGMRLGDMSIFHRHADSNGNGPVIFSMANMVKPGTFDMAQMDEFTTPGVSLFMQLPSPISNMQGFDRLLGTAQALRDNLGGQLTDENRSVLTRQTIEHYRQRIRDFELRQLSRKA